MSLFWPFKSQWRSNTNKSKTTMFQEWTLSHYPVFKCKIKKIYLHVDIIYAIYLWSSSCFRSQPTPILQADNFKPLYQCWYPVCIILTWQMSVDNWWGYEKIVLAEYCDHTEDWRYLRDRSTEGKDGLTQQHRQPSMVLCKNTEAHKFGEA